MKFRVDRGDFRQFLAAGTEAQIAADMTAAAATLTDGLKGELRAQVAGAGLGTRLANTWQGKTFPQGRTSLDPTAYVWSKSPKLAGVYDAGAVILPTDGRRYLAIPTPNVPRKGRGRFLTPVEVEAAFDQELFIKRSRAGNWILCLKAVAANNKRGFRKATAKRLASGRALQLVVMFTLVRQVTVRKRLDVAGATQRWVAKIPQILGG